MKSYHKNPRRITKQKLDKLADTLDRLGDLGGIVHNLETDEIIGGHQRMKVFTDGKPEVLQTYPEPDEQGTVGHGFIIWKGKRYAYRQVRWDAETAEEANITANAGGGTWDWDVIANAWEPTDLIGWGLDDTTLADWRRDVAALGELVEAEKPDPVADPGAQIDKAEELRELWGCELGQMWQLGDHRLICGDCTDAAVVERVMGGEKADCVATDPPYGVDYVGKTKDKLVIANDGKDELPALLSSSLRLAFDASREGACWYVAAPPGPQLYEFATVLLDLGIWRQTISWQKNTMVLGHSDYHYKHEVIFYGWKPGAAHNSPPDRTQTTIWEFDKPSASREHPTMKPVALYVLAIQNSTFPADLVYEPFSGSGTTLIACEQLNRQCRAVEISPGYVAVALQRWADMTGESPMLIE